MARLFRTMTTVVVLAAAPARSSPPRSAVPPSSQVLPDEAALLNAQVEKLLAEGKYRQALMLAKRALEHRSG